MTRDLNMANLEAAAYDLMDYDSGACLGPATAEQVEASLDAETHDGGAGVILVDDQGRVLRSDDRGASEARRCYVRD